MGLRRWTALVSLSVFIFSVFSLWQNGLHLGLDFTGGSQIEVSYQQAADLSSIRKQLVIHGYHGAVVQHYGRCSDVLITLPPGAKQIETDLDKKLNQVLPGGVLRSVNFIGPQVGKELTTSGLELWSKILQRTAFVILM